MPRITEYAPQMPGLDAGGAPQAAGEIAGGLYQGIGSGFHSIGEALQRYGEQQETSKLHVAATTLQTQAESEWRDLKQNGDITDPEAVQKFNDQYQQKFDALTDNITSPAVRAHADELLASMKGSLQNRTQADSAIATGVQAQENYTNIVNSFSSLAANDPTFYEEGAKQLDMMVAASGLPANKIPEAQLKARQELARSTVKGAGETLDPGYINQMQVELKSGRFDADLNEDQKATALKFLHQRQDEAIEAQKTQERLAKQQLEENSKTAVTGYQQQLTQPDVNFQDWAKSVLNDPNVTPQDRESVIRFGHFMIQEPITEQRAQEREDRAEARATKADARGIQAQRSEGFWNAWSHINSGDLNSPSQIMDLATRHIIDLKDVNPLMTEYNRVNKSKTGDPDQALRKNAYDGLREKFKEQSFSDVPFHDAFPAIQQLDEQETRDGVPAMDRYNPESPKYIGRGLKFDGGLDDKDLLDNPAAPAPAAKKPVHKSMPVPGEVQNGYRFLHGNPADPKSWERVK